MNLEDATIMALSGKLTEAPNPENAEINSKIMEPLKHRDELEKQGYVVTRHIEDEPFTSVKKKDSDNREVGVFDDGTVVTVNDKLDVKALGSNNKNDFDAKTFLDTKRPEPAKEQMPNKLSNKYKYNKEMIELADAQLADIKKVIAAGKGNENTIRNVVEPWQKVKADSIASNEEIKAKLKKESAPENTNEGSIKSTMEDTEFLNSLGITPEDVIKQLKIATEEFNEISKYVSEYKGTFKELYKELQGWNLGDKNADQDDDNLFDCYYKSLLITVAVDNGVLSVIPTDVYVYPNDITDKASDELFHIDFDKAIDYTKLTEVKSAKLENKEINIPIEKFAKEFNKEYQFLYDNNDNVAGYSEALDEFDARFGSSEQFKNFVSEFAKFRGDIISSDREAVAFMFAMEKYLVNESKSLTEAKYYTWDEIMDRAEGKTFGDVDLKFKDTVRANIEKEMKSYNIDLSKAEVPEDEIEEFIKFHDIMFDEDGDVVYEEDMESDDTVVLVANGKIYWEGPLEKFLADEENLRILVQDVAAEDGINIDTDEVDVFNKEDFLTEAKSLDEEGRFALLVRPEELEFVNIDSLAFDSDTTIASYSKGSYSLYLMVQGEIKIINTENGDVYKNAQSFPEDLKELIMNGELDNGTDKYDVDMNNWFEYFLDKGDETVWYDVATIEGSLGEGTPEELEAKLEAIMKETFEDIVSQLDESKSLVKEDKQDTDYEKELAKLQDELRGINVSELSDEEYAEYKKKAERIHELVDKIYTVTNLKEAIKPYYYEIHFDYTDLSGKDSDGYSKFFASNKDVNDKEDIIKLAKDIGELDEDDLADEDFIDYAQQIDEDEYKDATRLTESKSDEIDLEQDMEGVIDMSDDLGEAFYEKICRAYVDTMNLEWVTTNPENNSSVVHGYFLDDDQAEESDYGAKITPENFKDIIAGDGIATTIEGNDYYEYDTWEDFYEEYVKDEIAYDINDIGLYNSGTTEGDDEDYDFYISKEDLEKLGLLPIDELDESKKVVESDNKIFDKVISIENASGDTLMSFKINPDGTIYEFNNCEVADEEDNLIRVQQIEE